MKKYILILVLLMLLVSCSPIAKSLSNDELVETAIIELQNTQEAEAIMNNAIATAEASMFTSTPDFTATPEPTATPIPSLVGSSRNNPFPREELVTAPNWDIRIIEVKRGQEAWNDIQAANMFNEAAPEGMEYLMVKIYAKCTYVDNDEHSISGSDFDVTGDRLIKYPSAPVVDPDPQLDASVYPGGETEGWTSFLVAQGEGNLMLVVDEIFNFDSDTNRYIAIDDGSSISVPSELASIKPSDAGSNRNSPASRSEKIIIADWEISITDVIRGAGAWGMVQQENQFNDPPEEGYEYIAVKTRVRNIDTEDRAASIDGSFFKSTGDLNILYDAPSVVDPSPRLDVLLYPGGEYEGWIVVQAAQGETNVALVIEPLFDFSGENKRFILLEP